MVDRTVLEWRLDPASPDRIPEAGDPDLRVIVVCRQGYSSSLAAASLQRLGLRRATDVIGGVEAWLAAGLPSTEAPPTCGSRAAKTALAAGPRIRTSQRSPFMQIMS